MTAEERGKKLDELNRQTFRDHFRNINDRDVNPGNPDSALDRPYRPGGLSLLEALRANAEQVYGEQVYGEAPKRTGRRS